ncbi:glycosyltransferase family 4 protein [Novosphingobium sp. UBA1939]|uniref:glycosyltransferase family 4 protein n=1 Tax=Novosphingobium sp. UBA1939 TaxID=1946982 RepID=UPI0026002B76|nr:glycosyltransferase family 4 protein [Novosphingobium sp. UBA1939]
MRIAYVSLSTPFSRASWSGIPWYSLREVQRRFPDTHVIDTPGSDKLVDRIATIERFGMNVRRNNLIAQYYSQAINEQLERLQPDAVIAVAAAHKIAYLDRKWPLIYVADAMYGTVVHYYDKYARNGTRWKAKGDALQRSLLERTDRILLGSTWAVEAAKQYYDLPAELMAVAPMGANLDSDPGFEPPALDRPLSLLFVGYNWDRKGGPLILDIWRELRRRTGNAELHIVGARPKAADGLDGVILHGRLNKTDPGQYETFLSLYRDAHFFIMPSRQEAYGIVYCEAAAFGRPAIAAQTGGVGTIVGDDRTGLLFPLEATPADYADRILALWSQPEAYVAMCRAARKNYEVNLNWHSWGGIVENAVREAVAKRLTAAG